MVCSEENHLVSEVAARSSASVKYLTWECDYSAAVMNSGVISALT